jgi:signal transduction histidine kinase
MYNGFKANKSAFYFLALSIVPLFSVYYYYIGTLFGLYDYDLRVFYWIKYAAMFEFFIMTMSMAYLYFVQRRNYYKLKISLNETQKEIIQIQEEEQDRIAKDLHDEIGNGLAALRMYVKDKFDDKILADQINNLMQLTRNISHNMINSNFENLTVKETIKEITARFNESKDIKFTSSILGAEHGLSGEQKLFIYRIILECFGNIAKHSHAKTAVLQLSFFPYELVITIEDDGIGFQNLGKQNSGIGLKNIKSRVNFLKGSIKIEYDKKGTLIIINIPLKVNKPTAKGII